MAHPHAVATPRGQGHGPAIGVTVEVGRARPASLGPRVRVPTATADPLSGGQCPRVTVDEFEDLREGPRARQIEAIPQQTQAQA